MTYQVLVLVENQISKVSFTFHELPKFEHHPESRKMKRHHHVQATIEDPIHKCERGAHQQHGNPVIEIYENSDDKIPERFASSKF